MEAKELRVGNFVRHKRGEDIIEQVVEQWLVPELRDIIEETYEPIPITEEWLLKFGFNATVGSDLRLTIPFINSLQLNYEDGTFFMSGDTEGQHTLLEDIEQVHKLQNFYFSNTGKLLVLPGQR